ncbi:MAG: adenylosuccinate lyase family protein [Nakamurella sp.]
MTVTHAWFSDPMMTRFTDGRVPDPGIRRLFAPANRWQRWLDVEAALALSESDLGVIPPGAGAVIAEAATFDRIDLDKVARGILATSHPVMALVRELSREAGREYGGWVHWGATSQNITQTGDVLVIRDAHVLLLGVLSDVLRAAGELAERGAEMVAAGRTHGQHAVPITFGFKVAAWIDELCRSADRLRETEPRLFTAMLGGAVGNFASLGDVGPAVQAQVAARLDLLPMAVPMRATADAFAEYVCVLGVLAGTIGRIARDVFAMMSTELAEAAEPTPTATVGSSTMPHKKNPQLTDDCIAISAQVRSLTPLALEAMLQDHEVSGAYTEMMDDALERGCVLTGDLLTRMRMILAGLELDRRRMRHNLELTNGLISSEAVMLALGLVIGRQQAHEVVRQAARQVHPGLSFADTLRRDHRVTDHLTNDELDALLDPLGHIGRSAEIARAAAERAVRVAAEIDRRIRDLPTPSISGLEA